MRGLRRFLRAAGFFLGGALLSAGSALLLGGCEELQLLFTPNGDLEQLEDMGVSDKVAAWAELDERGIGLAVYEDRIYVITPKHVFEVKEKTMEVAAEYSYTGSRVPQDYDEDRLDEQRMEQWAVRPHGAEGNLIMMNSVTGQTITLSDRGDEEAAVGEEGSGKAVSTPVWDTFNPPSQTREAQWEFDAEAQYLYQENNVMNTAQNGLPLDTLSDPWGGSGLPGDHQLVNGAVADVAGGNFVTALCFSPGAGRERTIEGDPYGVLLYTEGQIDGSPGGGDLAGFVLDDYDAEWAGEEEGGLYFPRWPRLCLREDGNSGFRVLLQINRTVYMYEVKNGKSKRVGSLDGAEEWMFDLSKKYVYALQREKNSGKCVLVKMVWGGG